MKRSFIVGIISIIISQMSWGDLLVGTFQNMDFDSPMPESGLYPEGRDPDTLSNFPWQFGSPYIMEDRWTLLAPVELFYFTAFFPINGTHSLKIFAPQEPFGDYADIHQIGSIPNNAKSVQISYTGTRPQIFIENTEVYLIETSIGILVGDVQAWAGNQVTLEIRITPEDPLNMDSYSSSIIDDVGFSEAFIPVLDNDLDLILDTWEIEHFSTIENCAPNEDPDGDYLTNLMEFRYESDPHVFNYSTAIFELQWQSALGSNYQIQACGNLTSNNWENAGGIRPGTNGIDAVIFPTISGQQFYRVITVP